LPPDALGAISIDNRKALEPPRWPLQYAVTMHLSETPAQKAGQLALRFNPADAELLFAGSGHTYSELSALAAGGKPLPWLALPSRLRATLKLQSGELKSDNILAVLPGSDPELAKQYVVISAHLDGYGIGEPWGSDNIYNGAFDDAAYVATLIDFAQRLRDSHLKPRRSILFCVVTAEEKGLFGSKYFAAHPTIPKDELVADINLDQLRPIFPLKTLTTLALNQSTLGETVKQVAGSLNIRIQEDPEPQRNLLRRSDHWNFMQIGVPSVGFIFGYEKGSPEEAVYREWYAKRYHSPLDDLNQPWVPEAAAKFNDFFAKLVETVADANERPHWKAGFGPDASASR
jgi:Zn-dependent M28 family amino/carboxypeptidase